jgi:hypothetical protein
MKLLQRLAATRVVARKNLSRSGIREMRSPSSSNPAGRAVLRSGGSLPFVLALEVAAIVLGATAAIVRASTR